MTRQGSAGCQAGAAWARLRPGHRVAGPSAASNPVSAKAGGGLSLSPSGRSLGHSSRGSARRMTRPPPRTQLVEVDERLRGLRKRMGKQQQARLLQRCGIRRGDRDHAVALFDCAERLGPALLKREALGENQRQCGQQHQRRPLRLRSRTDPVVPPSPDERERGRSRKQQRHRGNDQIAAPKSGAWSRLFFAAVVRRRLAAGSDAQLRKRLVGFTLIELRLVLRDGIVVA